MNRYTYRTTKGSILRELRIRPYNTSANDLLLISIGYEINEVKQLENMSEEYPGDTRARLRELLRDLK